jgi:type I restriction enzyme S subunit
MSVRAPVGPTNIAVERCAVGRGLAVIRAKPGVPPNLIRHAIKLQESEIASWGTGSTFTAINKQHFKDIKVPLAPLGERERIASLLDSTVKLRRSSTSHLIAARRAIERFRQAVLATACSGRLTADWRGSDGFVEWPRVRLDEVCESITDGDHQAPPQVATGVPFITISAINDGQLRLEKATRSVSSSYYEALKAPRRPKRGDVLFSVTGSIGIPARVDTDERFTFQRHIAILRPDLSRILSSYLFYALGTSDIKKQGLVVATGTAQLTIPLGGLRSFVIPLPPVAEQQEIVRRVDQLLAVADGLRQRIDIASTRVDRSSQAVLAKALGGELVPGGTTLDQ